MYSADRSGFKNVLIDFYKQIEGSRGIYEKSKVKIDGKKVRNIVYIGMGGSAISGNLMKDILFDTLRVPLNVVQSYFVPGYADEATLAIVSSYSGNTEEALSAARGLGGKACQVVAITSGGKLETMAGENGWNLIKIPQGFPSSQALGFLFFPIYHLLGELGLISDYSSDLGDLIRFARDTGKRNSPGVRVEHVLSRELAQTIQKKIPVIYSTSPYLRTVSRRWQNRFTENSKTLAFSNVIPEINHNEIVGWELDLPSAKEFIVIFVENEDLHPRMKRRIELTQALIKKRGVQVVDIYASGTSILEKVFSLVILGDWVSYYLALAYGKDPLEIDNIDYLKREMEKM